MICSKCGSVINEGEMFCGECGTPAEKSIVTHIKKSRDNRCTNCGAIITEGDAFCGECGTPVKVNEATPEKSEVAAISGGYIEVENRYCSECGRKLSSDEMVCSVCSIINSDSYIKPITDVSSGEIKTTMKESKPSHDSDAALRETAAAYFKRPRDI